MMKNRKKFTIWQVIIACMLCAVLGGLYGRIRILREVNTDNDINQKTSVGEKVDDVDGPFTRSKHLRQYCDKLYELGQVPVTLKRNSYNYLYVNDQYKFIFCMIPKLACTNWKRIFLALSDDFKDKELVLNKIGHYTVHAYHKIHNKILSDYSDEEIEKKLRTYKKLTFVRDPFERLLSAYKDKISGYASHDTTLNDIIITLKRKDKSDKGNVKFLEFIQYLTDPDTFESSYNQHWAKYTHLCEPCIVKYDFIGKFETMNNDVDMAFKYIGINNGIKFPQRNASYKNTKSVEVVNRFYGQIPEYYLRKLYHLFKSDYLSFSYSLPEVLSGLSDL